jgi:hypothetical protein
MKVTVYALLLELDKLRVSNGQFHFVSLRGPAALHDRKEATCGGGARLFAVLDSARGTLT